MDTLTYSSLPSDAAKREKRISIKIDSIDTGCYPSRDSTKLIACVGPKDSYTNYPCQFTLADGVHRMWSFTYLNREKSSFVVAIYKKKFFQHNMEIGKIEIPLSSIELYNTTQQEYKIPVRNFSGEPITIKLTIEKAENNLTEIGSQISFSAPASVSH